ncbi:hypothetical protein BaRGS_00036799 [Batillaria attramentaria]|uniref:Uncharacterized protein n=1 Tax=Batillaria attramentaria TaxID=370345 RepID=A0ABD0JAT2_9CAEN
MRMGSCTSNGSRNTSTELPRVFKSPRPVSKSCLIQAWSTPDSPHLLWNLPTDIGTLSDFQIGVMQEMPVQVGCMTPGPQTQPPPPASGHSRVLIHNPGPGFSTFSTLAGWTRRLGGIWIVIEFRAGLDR